MRRETDTESRLVLPISRRRFVQGLAAGGEVATLDWGGWSSFGEVSPHSPATLTGKHFDPFVGFSPAETSSSRKILLDKIILKAFKLRRAGIDTRTGVPVIRHSHKNVGRHLKAFNQIIDSYCEGGLTFTVEAVNLEFRADLFNIFNRVNLDQPVSDLSSGQFGTSTPQSIPRSSQFGLLFTF
jgi:hypothetical protein